VDLLLLDIGCMLPIGLFLIISRRGVRSGRVGLALRFGLRGVRCGRIEGRG